MKAVVFDMDGVIADTEIFHTEAKQKVLRSYGIESDAENLENRFAGTPSEQMFLQLFQENNVDGDPDEAASRKRDIYHEMIEGQVKEIEGVANLIHDLYGAYPLVLASSSSPRNIRTILDSTGLHKFFEEKISAKEDGIDGKPAPDIYQEAARRLGVKPGNCVAIEDSDNGARSANRAGMKVVGYQLDTDDVDLTVENFRELEVEDLERL